MKVQQSSMSGRDMKVTEPEAFAHSNKVWRKKIFNSWINLSSPSKVCVFLSLYMTYIRQWGIILQSNFNEGSCSMWLSLIHQLVNTMEDCIFEKWLMIFWPLGHMNNSSLFFIFLFWAKLLGGNTRIPFFFFFFGCCFCNCLIVKY